jgi:amino acid adenylation domain-containing protein
MQVYPVDVSIRTDDTIGSLHKRVARAVMTTVRNARPGLSPDLSDVEAVVNVIPRGGISRFGEHDVTTEWIHPGATDPNHLFQLQLTTYHGGEPQLSIDVNTAAAGSQRERIPRHLGSIIATIARDPEAPIGAESLTTSSELRSLRDWGDRRQEQCEGPLLPERLAKTLGSSTLIDGDRILTGDEFVSAVARTAHWLQSRHGVTSGDRVAIQMGRSADAVLLILGCWWIGASYVPIDPGQPELRRTSLVERAGCVATISKLPPLPDQEAAPAAVGPDDEAYLLFTSGSTGEPKGVPIRHRGVADYLHFAQTHYLSKDQKPVVPLFTALTFDLTVTSLFLPLLTAGTLIVVEPDGVPGLKQMAQNPTITWAKATPSHVELLLRLLPDEHDLRTLVMGGEALSARLTNDIWAWHPNVRVFNEYGPTEAVVGCMIYEASPEDTWTDIPIGIPAPGVELRVVDQHGCDVPSGSPGELLIFSRGVTEGYLGSEPDTSPFVELDGRRFYRSGDLARFVAPNLLGYLGRADEQIKVGGIRLDPIEVEAQLELHPHVRRAAVRLRNDVLVSWYEGEPTTPGELRTWLAARVPTHAVPVAFVPVVALPTTTNGKLDRSALPDPSADHRVGHGGSVELSVLESVIATLWQNRLGIEKIGPDDSFFDLGGDSLAGMQSMLELSQQQDLVLPEELIFQHPSPRLLAAAVEATPAATNGPRSTSESEIPPLTPGERAMVFAWLNSPDSTANNVGRAYTVEGALDPHRFETAARNLVARHLPFRLTFTEDRRAVSAEDALEYSVDLEPLAGPFDSVATARFLEHFDPELGPRIRIHLQALAQGHTGIVFSMHHALIDEAGLDVLFTDLAALYDGRPLPDLAVGYEKFAATQIDRSDRAEDRAYWSARPVVEPIVFGASRHGEGDGYAEISAGFPATHLDRIEGLSAAANCLGALAEVIARSTGRTTVEIGMPISVRSSQHRDLAGYALNVVPLVVNTDSAMSSAAEALSGAITHRHYPFASIVADRRKSGRPIPPLNILLAYGTLGSAAIGGFAARHRVLAPEDATADVTFFVQRRGEEVNLAVEYSGTAMNSDTALELLTSFRAHLAGTNNTVKTDHTAGPDHGRTSESLVAPVSEALLDDIVAEIAASSPDAIAVKATNPVLTYRELIGQANSIAHHVLDLGAEPGDFVCVMASRSLESIAVILGVMRAGCAYVPVDPDYPQDRINTILEDSGASIVLDPASCDLSTSAADPPTAHRSTNDTAYAVFTSGSTGRPKGVEISHSNIVYSTLVRSQVYSHEPSSFLLLSSLAFDSSMVGLWWTLCNAGQIVLPDPGLHADIDHLGELIERNAATHLLAIPSLYAILLSEVGLTPLRSLNTVIVAGEACPPNLITAHHERLPATELHNEYGPTEATVWSHHHRFEPDVEAGGPVPIGTVIPGAFDLVLDDMGRPVPVGGSGELFVGGPGVSTGYLNKPELTAERFVDIEGHRFYRTGDLVRVLGDGALEFIGRTDNQVKIRGVRIELGEIESTILTDPAIRSASVGTVETSNGPRVAAWYSPAVCSSVDPDELRNQLRAILPEAMVPSYLVEVAEMPLTPNGKIDRSALPDPSTRATSTPSSEPQGAASPAEEIMGRIWADVLGATSVSPNDNFFDLGGDSILSIRIVAGLRRHGIRVRPRDLFEHPTIAELAAVATMEASAAPAASQSRLVGTVPLLPMQRWFFAQDFSEPNHWNQSMWFEVSGPIDRQTLRKSLARVIDHHDALRATFTQGPQSWSQEVPETGTEPAVQEFRNLNDAAIAAVAESVEASLDIERGELLGAAIFRQRDSADRVFLTIHHLAIDGVSWRPLLEDLTSAYQAVVDGRRVQLPARTASVADWAAALEALEVDPHWTQLEKDLPEPSKVRHSQDAGQQTTVTVEAGPIDGLVDRLLIAIGRAHREVFGWKRLTATLEGHGRTETLDVDLSRTVGWFTAMYPVSVDLSNVPTGITEAPNDGVGALQSMTRMPRLVINYLGQLDRSLAPTALLTPLSGILAGYGNKNHRTHDLGVLAHVADGQLHVTWDYVPEDYSPSDIDLVIEAFKRYFTAPRFDLVDLSTSDLDTLASLLD